MNNRQRAVLVDKLPDTANVAVGALFFGQFLSGVEFTWESRLRSGALDGARWRVDLVGPKGDAVMGFYVLGGGLLLIVTIIVFLDWLADRQKHKAHR